MADEADRESRTEAASAQRLQQAWNEGQTPVGHDVVHVAGLAAAALALVALAPILAHGLSALLGAAAAGLDRPSLGALAPFAVRPVAAVVAVCAAAGAASVAAGLVQTRGGFWPHLAGPDVSRLFGLGRVTRLASREVLLDLALAVAKVVAIGAAAWSALRGELPTLAGLLGASADEQLATAFRVVAAAAKPVLATALALAGADVLLQRWRFAVKMRMTKEEVKREAKEEDGDPVLRGQRKRRHRELLRNQARAEVPRADALVVNPTHIAIAIRYRKDEGRAPRVTAKGKGVLAELMRDLARENGIPIVQDVPLARLLYRKVKVGRAIPAQTYKAVAAILAFVYRVTRSGSVHPERSAAGAKSREGVRA